MRHLGLKTDGENLKAGARIVYDWIRLREYTVTLDVLEKALANYQLYLPIQEEHGITVYLESIEEKKHIRAADYKLSWRDYFVKENNIGGHQLKDPINWNKVLLPQVEVLKDTINRVTDCKLIRVYGPARISCWFAFGFVFRDVSHYILDVEQDQTSWRTDAEASKDFPLNITSAQGSPYGEVLDEGNDVVAIGISVFGSLDEHVRKYLAKSQEKVGTLLLISPQTIDQKLQKAGDVVALAQQIKRAAQTLIDYRNATKILIFYRGPASGACFIGHQLNAMNAQIQIMEDMQPGYAPSFLLK